MLPLNDDLIFEVAKFLPAVADVLSLVKVCQATWRIGKNCFLWVKLLEKVRQSQPLGCPRYTDLRKLNLFNLKCLALHTAELDRRWDHPICSPRYNPSHPIRLGQKAEFISLVSGGQYIFIHSNRKKIVSCWDLSTVPASTVASVHVGMLVLCVSQPYEDQGVFRIALLSAARRSGTSSPVILRVLSLSYGTTCDPHFCQTFQKTLDRTFDYHDTFLCNDYVGVIRTSPSSTNITVDILSVSTATLINSVQTSLSYIWGSTGCYIFNDHLYFVLEQDGLCHVHAFDWNDLLPRDHHRSSLANIDCITKGPFLWDWCEQPTELVAVIPGMPTYGINCVSIQHISKQSDGLWTTTVRFWPAYTTNGSEYLEFGDATGFTVSFPGEIKTVADEYLLFVGHSRSWVLLVLVLHTNDLALRLVEFRHETKSMFVHSLKVSQALDLNKVTSIGLDDHRGEAFLIDSSGVLFHISYV